MTDSVIECRNLTHCYGERLIYKDLSFEVPRGRILGLLGKNGTGKTTTINILSGYLQPRAGQCLIFGEDIRTMRPETRARIALLIEGHVQYAFMTIEQIERFYARFYPRWNRDAYYGLMEMLKVAPRQRISRMSCGQRSQVALGLILAQNADLLVLDETSPLLAGRDASNLIDTWIFAGNSNLVRDVMVNGDWVVRDFRHRDEARIAARYRAVIARLHA